MRIIYHSSDLRMVVKKRKEYGQEVLRLEIQSGTKLLFWIRWKETLAVDIQLEEYWSPTRGTKYAIKDHLTMRSTFGDVTEVWFPEDFDPEKRIASLWAEYFNRHRGELRSKKLLAGI